MGSTPHVREEKHNKRSEEHRLVGSGESLKKGNTEDGRNSAASQLNDLIDDPELRHVPVHEVGAPTRGREEPG